MKTDWINPDRELPPIGEIVIIALGDRQTRVDTYRLATVQHSGGFLVSNGADSPYTHYSEKSPHRRNNAYRVLAWAAFEKCDVNEILEQEDAE